MSKLLPLLLIPCIWTTVLASEISREYQIILYSYAEGALSEFDVVENQSLSKHVNRDAALYVLGLDKIGREIFVVLFPNESGSVYVSFMRDKDDYLEIQGRGGLLLSPEQFKKDFTRNVGYVVHYPGST